MIFDGICSIANHHEIFFLWQPLSTEPDDYDRL